MGNALKEKPATDSTTKPVKASGMNQTDLAKTFAQAYMDDKRTAPVLKRLREEFLALVRKKGILRTTYKDDNGADKDIAFSLTDSGRSDGVSYSAIAKLGLPQETLLKLLKVDTSMIEPLVKSGAITTKQAEKMTTWNAFPKINKVAV